MIPTIHLTAFHHFITVLIGMPVKEPKTSLCAKTNRLCLSTYSDNGKCHHRFCKYAQYLQQKLRKSAFPYIVRSICFERDKFAQTISHTVTQSGKSLDFSLCKQSKLPRGSSSTPVSCSERLLCCSLYTTYPGI